MEVTESKGVIALKQQLQRYFRKLVAALQSIENNEASSKKQISSLANLLEQRESVVKVDASNLRLTSQFPDLHSRLLVKLSAEVDLKVEALNGLIGPLKEQHDLALLARTEATNLFHKHRDHLSLDILSAGSPTVPPLAVMLDWVDSLERQTRELFWSRVYYLDNVYNADVLSSENLVSLWSEDVQSLLDTIRDCDEQTRFFLEEKL